MKKTLFAIALIASLTAGAALQANGKPAKKPAEKQWYERPTIVPTNQIKDPGELNKQIRSVNSKMRKSERKQDRFRNDRTKAANKGNLREVRELINKLRAKRAKIAKHEALSAIYTLRLASLKAKELKKEEPKKDTKKSKEKKKKEEPKKKANEKKKEEPKKSK